MSLFLFRHIGRYRQRLILRRLRDVCKRTDQTWHTRTFLSYDEDELVRRVMKACGA